MSSMEMHEEFRALTTKLIDYHQTVTGADLTYMHEVCEQDGYDAMFADTLHGLSTATIPLPRDLWEQCRSYVEGDELDDLLAIPILDD